MLNRSREVLASLARNDVRYVIIGSVAAILHGVPRATFDLDILIDNTEDNARRLLKAFLEAGMGTATLTDEKRLMRTEITVFNDFVRIDVQTSTPGIRFADAWQHRLNVDYEGIALPVVSREHLIAPKRAAGRQVDLADVRLLEHPRGPVEQLPGERQGTPRHISMSAKGELMTEQRQP